MKKGEDGEHISEDQQEDEYFPQASSSNLLILSLSSSLVYLILALAIYSYFYEASIKKAFEHGFSVTGQLLGGLAAGFLAAGVIRFVSSRPPVSEVLDDFYIVRMIKRTRFSAFDRIQLSLFAGAGEELLFRGAIQPLLGIWFTSVIFVGIHGYFRFDSAGHWLFAGLMFGLSVMLGFLYEYTGLISAMSAHAVYDIIMLWWVKRNDEF